MEQLKQVTEAGADFALSPVMFTREMLDYCRERGVISVPGAFTPSEIYTQLTWGADIVKVFPAVTVGPSYFRQLAGPLGSDVYKRQPTRWAVSWDGTMAKRRRMSAARS